MHGCVGVSSIGSLGQKLYFSAAVRVVSRAAAEPDYFLTALFSPHAEIRKVLTSYSITAHVPKSITDEQLDHAVKRM